MDSVELLKRVSKLHMVGIKGTGMAALAELLVDQGVRLTGSDVAEKFFTDEILTALQISPAEGFDARHVPTDAEMVIYSSAYNPQVNPELVHARERGLPLLNYTQALGAFSARFTQPGGAAGISGVHGKTTTTAMAGVVARALRLSASVLAGSIVPDFGERATLRLGSRWFIAETCEYQRHFLDFHPSTILCTSVELDHTDYFHDKADIASAFVEYAQKLPRGGTLIYCADEAGAAELARSVEKMRPDVERIAYGFEAASLFRITQLSLRPGMAEFTLQGWRTPFALAIPGRHNVLNAAGALALIFSLFKSEQGRWPLDNEVAPAAQALAQFKGTRRRSQIVGEIAGILVMDDYGHHPTAIATTLRGLREFFPDRRLVVDFMSHTYSRTRNLLDEFAACFDAADEVILHKIYASAREIWDNLTTGRLLYDKVRALRGAVRYFEEPLDALPYYLESLHEGDLLVTMGAGDNWKVGQAFLAKKSAQGPAERLL
ncbi:MAG: UDP-N-acetylmuramate--L-alanine ligase [Spirochaetales bacterium]|nr:UDP-N-acetylmuramate--L-alanine ligase [Spirochaetales bacterium]